MDILFALITSVGHAVEVLFIRKGLVRSPTPMAAAFITLTINFSFFVLLSILFLPGHLFRLDLIYVFIIAGLLAPALGRAFSYKSLDKLGVSIASPILNTDSSFSVAMALLFLGEPLSLLLAIGIASVLTGVVLLGYETGRHRGITAPRTYKSRHLLYPLCAACLFGVSVFLRKLGLTIINSPLLGAAVTSATSWCGFTIFMVASGHIRGVSHVKKGSLVYFLIAGGLNCVTWLGLFKALSLGRVSIVSPIAGCFSLFSLLLSAAFLRDVERITVRIVLATILIVSGVVILSLAR
jgi:drug/metabolite transporter, DME family